MDLKNKPFVNSNYEPISYDGSPITWRISAYAIIIKNKHIFLVRTKPNKFYDLPGGGIEMGESITQALKREALEEAGLHIHPGKIIGYHEDHFYHSDNKQFHQTLLLFLSATTTGKQTKPTDLRVEFANFVPLNQLEKYPTYDYALKIIRDYTKTIKLTNLHV